MFSNVIVGVDGEDGGRDALALALILLAEGGRLTLANVYPGGGFLWEGNTPAYHLLEEDEAHAVLQAARREAGIEAELRVVGDPSVGKGLHLVAEESEADLLVIGSSRRSLAGRVMLGDDIRAAINGAPCAVAIAPAGYAAESKALREIGVGYDGSRESEHALGVARELAARFGAKLSAFEAVSVPSYAVRGRNAIEGTSLSDLVEKARERVAALEGVEPHAAYGKPGEELALYSASLDLLVVGSRDYGPVGRMIHGSTTLELAGSARCPLLALTRAARKADSGPAGDRRSAVASTAS